MSNKLYRILSLDGGGTWALIQAKALGELFGYDTDGWKILERFDFAAANSGGALVLGMLLKGLSPAEILALFRSQRDRELIFDRSDIVGRALGGLFGFGPRYHAPGKLAGLNDIYERANGRCGAGFGELTLDRVAATLNEERRSAGLGDFHFLIATFDYDAERSVFFRSHVDSASASFRTAPCPTIIGALHATTNAPMQYFNRPAEVTFADGSALHYWDGAVGGYNNPVMAAVLEALANDGARRDRVRVLSIGTGTPHLPLVGPDWPGAATHVVRRRRPRGPDGIRVMSDLRKITAAMMSDRPEAAIYMAHIALGGSPAPAPHKKAGAARIVRLNPMLQPRYTGTVAGGQPSWEAYDWFAEPSSVRGQALFERLIALDMDATGDGEVQDIERLADLWVAGKVPNQPVHADERLLPHIGHAQFAEALAAWRAIDAKEEAPAAAPRPSPLREAVGRLADWLRRWRPKPAPAIAAGARIAPLSGIAEIGKSTVGGEGGLFRGSGN